MSNPTFHNGLTFAGAVSAGCYTGGVMDYLFEILDLWYEQKENPTTEFEGFIPTHDVVIDALGGASAGGMTASMAVIELMKKKRTPIQKPEDKEKAGQNTFYKSWVKMDDSGSGPKTTTLYKMLDNIDDLKHGMTSLLNSDPIDSIAERAFPKTGSLQEAFQNLPKYVSQELELVLSLCMLHGIPLDVDFRTPMTLSRPSGGDSPHHSTWEHFTMGHFKLSSTQDQLKDNGYLWLNPFHHKSREILKLTTIATGAFPIGLKSRHFNRDIMGRKYLQKMAERIIFRRFGNDQDQQLIDEIKANVISIIEASGLDSAIQNTLKIAVNELPTGTYEFFNADPDRDENEKSYYDKIPENDLKAIQDALTRLPKFVDWSNFVDHFEFSAVDGGTINNEPYSEVHEIVKNRMHEDLMRNGLNLEGQTDAVGDPFKMHGTIMIDPFPDVAQNKKVDYTAQTDIRKIAGRLVGTLINQSRIKRYEMVQQAEEKNIKGVIFPVKYERILQANGQFKKGEKCEPAIASDSLRAFGGFISQDFREHDFFLGRNNARNFFRYWFSLPFDPEDQENCHPIHRDWTPEMRDLFKVKRGNQWFLPIIPDLYKVIEKDGANLNSWDRFLDYDIPETPTVTVGNVEGSYYEVIRKRVKALVNAGATSMKQDQIKEEEDETPIADKWWQENARSNWVKRFGLWMYLKIGKAPAEKMLSKQVMNTILSELEKKGLLKG